MKSRLRLFGRPISLLVVFFYFTQVSFAQAPCDCADDPLYVQSDCPGLIQVTVPAMTCSLTLDPQDLGGTFAALGIDPNTYFTWIGSPQFPNLTLAPNLNIEFCNLNNPVTITANTGVVTYKITGQYIADPNEPDMSIAGLCLGEGVCELEIQVVDQVPPMITCPAAITLNASATCDAFASSAMLTATASDDCSIATITNSFNANGGDASDLYPLGTTVVTFTATDVSGNSASCNTAVTVMDNTPPTVTCPATGTIAVPADPMTCEAVVTVPVVAFGDNCMGASIVNDSPYATNNGADASGTYPTGTHVVTFTVTDAAGNTNTSCTQTISVADATAPVITSCPTNIGPIDTDGGQCTAFVTVPLPTVDENCGFTITNNMNANASASGIYPLGMTTVTYTVTNDAGAVVTCSLTVTVEDNEGPIINCPANIVVNNDPGMCSAVVTYTAPVGTDNCMGSVTTAQTDLTGLASGSTFPVGVTMLEYTTTDATGATAVCNFSVTVNDGSTPSITCPGDMTVPTTTIGGCDAVVNGIAPTIGNTSCPGMTAYSYTLTGATTGSGTGDASGTAFMGGTTTVTYFVVGGASCSFDITVDDTQNPSLSCPQSQSISASAGSCTGSVTLGDPIFSDNCSVQSLTYMLTDAGGTVIGSGAGNVDGIAFGLGATTVTYTVTDMSGNSSVCNTLIITVNDTEDPTIACGSTGASVNVDAGACTAVVNGISFGTVSDNCTSVANLAVTYSISGALSATGTGDASGTTFPVGTSTVVYTVTDSGGNTANCMFDVTVSDNENPVLTCPVDIVVNTDGTIVSGAPTGVVVVGACETTVSYAAPVGTDNCTGVNTVQTAGLASGSNFPVGVTTITYTTTDGANNAVSCSFTVTVVDVDDPIVTGCPGDASINSDATGCSSNYTWTHPTVTDGCPGGELVVSYDGGTSFINVTLDQGMSATQNFPIGTTTISYIATDASGNSTTTCTFDVTVADMEAPTITCPGNQVLTNSLGQCAANATNLFPLISDNCGVTALSYVITGNTTSSSPLTGLNDASGTPFNLGTSTVTYTAVDAAGNSISCSFTVTVSDQEAPIIVCPVDQTVSADANSCTAVVNGIGIQAQQDNCGITSITHEVVHPDGTITTGGTDVSGTTFQIGTTTVTYTAKDAAGNDGICDFTVTVEDDEDPVMNFCPLGPIQIGTDGAIIASGGFLGLTTSDPVPFPKPNLSNNDACTMQVSNLGDLTATDNCGIASESYTISGGGNGTTTGSFDPTTINDVIFGMGTSTITYTATDTDGNTVTCTFDLEVLDNEPPAMYQFPLDRTVANDPGSCFAVVNNLSPLLIDNCPLPRLTAIITLPDGTVNTILDDVSGFAFPVGTTCVEYQFVDRAGNSVGVDATHNPSCSGIVKDENNVDITVSDAPVYEFCVTVNDSEPPVLVQDVSDATFDCNGGSRYVEFLTWFRNRAGFIVSDNCDISYDLFAPTMPTVGPAANDTLAYFMTNFNSTCGNAGDITVTWTATDISGNSVVSTPAVFTIEDNTAPTFQFCPASFTVNTSNNGTGDCDADATFDLPIITDDCLGGTTCSFMSAVEDVEAPSGTSTNALPNTVVDPVTLNIAVPIGQVALGTVLVDIDLFNIDGEFGSSVNSTEFFFIVNENSDTISTTAVAPAQCHPQSTTTVSVSASQFNQWATDGNVTFMLHPFNPTGSANDNEGINDICGGSTAQATASYECATIPGGYTLDYIVDENNDGVAPDTTLNVAFPSTNTNTLNNLEIGTHAVTYVVTDCNGNSNSCSFVITVVDDELPALTCAAPLDTMTNAALTSPAAGMYQILTTSCDEVGIALQRPTGLFDNCGFGNGYNQTTSPNFLTFGPHPNIDQPVAADASFSFNVPAANAIGNGSLTITFEGDFDDPSDYMTIEDENGNNLSVIGDDTNTSFGATSNGASCGTSSTVSVTVPQATLNAWAADGVISFTAVSNVLNIAPAPPGPTPSDEGVNPCGPLSGNGEDGISNITLGLSFPSTTATYAVSNASTTATTNFPSDGSDPIVSLLPGFNDVAISISDNNGNINTCEYTIEVQSFTLTTPDLSATVPTCAGDLVTLTEDSGNTYTPGTQYDWFIETDGLAGLTPGDVLINTTSANVFNISALPGINEYYVQVRDLNGCISAGSPNAAVVNGGNGVVAPDIFPINNPVCEGTTFGFGLSNSDASWVSYTWVGPNGYTSNLPSPPFIQDADGLLNEGQYFLIVEDANGCTAQSDVVFVDVFETPEQPSIGAVSALCPGEPIILTSSATCDSYIWIGPDGASSSTLSNPLLQTTSSTTTIPPGDAAYDAGMWSVICVTDVFSNFSCQSEPSAAVEVILSNPIAVAPSNSGPACTGQNVSLTVGGISSAASYSWTGPNGFTSTNQNPVLNSANMTDNGVYTVEVTDVNGCTGTGTTSVAVTESPVVTAVSVNPPAGTCVAGSDNITLNPTVTPLSTNYTYSWTGPNGFTSTSASPVLTNGTTADNGSYTLVVNNGNGCASAAMTVVVDVIDAPVTPALAVNAAGLCEGEDLTLTTGGYTGTNVTYEWYEGTSLITTTTSPSYTINDVDANDSGNYYVVVNVDGCESNNSQTIPVAVSSPASVPVISGPLTICEGEILQLETTLIPGATYSWVGPNGFSASVFNPSVFPVTASSAGTYQVQVMLNGCASNLSTPLNITVNSAPTAPTGVNNGPICIDDPNALLTLSVTAGSALPGATYEWFDAATNTSIGTSGLSTSFNLTNLSDFGEGAFDFYVVATVGGCTSDLSVPTTVMLTTTPTEPAFAGTDVQVCDGLTTTLNASAPTVGIGTWTQMSGPTAVIVNPNAPNSTVSALVGGNTYTFRWTLSNGGCGDYSEDDVVVEVDAASQAAEAGNLVQVCNTDNATLSALPANPGNVGTWTQSGAQSMLGVVITDPTDPNSGVTGLQPGNNYQFTWTLSNTGCGVFASDIVEVNVANSQVSAFAGADISACGDADAIVTATPSTGCTGSWSSPDPEIVFINPNAVSTVVMDLKPGDNTLVWTIDCGACGSTSDEVIITFEDAPAAVNDLISVPFSGLGTIVVTDNDNVPAGYTVNIINQPVNGTLTQTGIGVYEYTHTGLTDGADQFTYEICSSSCPDVCSTAQVGVTINVDDQCTVPTIFTPNGDGINDDFVVQCLFASGKYPNNNVAIFNEWGDEVFRAEPYNNDWQGTYNGEDLPVGTYFYIVDLGDGSTPMTGFLLIER